MFDGRRLHRRDTRSSLHRGTPTAAWSSTTALALLVVTTTTACWPVSHIDAASWFGSASHQQQQRPRFPRNLFGRGGSFRVLSRQDDKDTEIEPACAKLLDEFSAQVRTILKDCRKEVGTSMGALEQELKLEQAQRKQQRLREEESLLQSLAVTNTAESEITFDVFAEEIPMEEMSKAENVLETNVVHDTHQTPVVESAAQAIDDFLVGDTDEDDGEVVDRLSGKTVFVTAETIMTDDKSEHSEILAVEETVPSSRRVKDPALKAQKKKRGRKAKKDTLATPKKVKLVADAAVDAVEERNTKDPLKKLNVKKLKKKEKKKRSQIGEDILKNTPQSTEQELSSAQAEQRSFIKKELARTFLPGSVLAICLALCYLLAVMVTNVMSKILGLSS